MATLVVLGTVGWRFAKQWLLHDAAQHAAIRVTTAQVDLANAPDWMDKLVRRHLRQLVVDQLSYDQLDNEALNRTVAALGDDPWVERVRRVRRRRGGTVSVLANYRKPVAVVADGHGYRRVDEAGVELPGLFVHGRLEALGLPVLVGVQSSARGPGLLWPGDDLAAGLALARVLDHQPYHDQIKYIDVSSRDGRGRSRLAIVTHRGRVRWGLPPNHGDPIEPDTEVKLRRLTQLHRQRHAIDADGKLVDIYGPEIFIRPAGQYDSHIKAGYTRSQ